MRVIWNRAKATANLLKYRVQFADAAEALHDQNALTVEDRDDDEHRFRSVAMTPLGDIVVVAFTMPDEATIRLISARKASKTERKHYVEEGWKHEH